MDMREFFLDAMYGLGAVLIGVATVYVKVIGQRVADKFKIEISKEAQAAYEAAIFKSLKTASEDILPMIEREGVCSPVVKEALINEATKLVIRNFPDAIDGVKATPDGINAAAKRLTGQALDRVIWSNANNVMPADEQPVAGG